MASGGKLSPHVIVVSLAIVYIYFSTVFVFVDQWFGLRSSPGIMNTVVFTAVAIMCIRNYVVAMFTDPGRVPPSFAPDIEDSEHPIHEIKRKGGDLRYCKKCSSYKPPRSHHCRICKRCVLRMDHHCVWMNNCVGHANYKVFFVFVVYAVLACLYSMILLLGSLTVDTQKDGQQPEGSYRTVYIISGMLLIALTMALGVFLGWHIHLTLQNKTTIEYYEGVRAMLLAEQGGNVYSHPYDLGVYENLTTVLGPNILCWVCPVSNYIGSGLRFRTGPLSSVFISSRLGSCTRLFVLLSRFSLLGPQFKIQLMSLVFKNKTRHSSIVDFSLTLNPRHRHKLTRNQDSGINLNISKNNLKSSMDNLPFPLQNPNPIDNQDQQPAQSKRSLAYAVWCHFKKQKIDGVDKVI